MDRKVDAAQADRAVDALLAKPVAEQREKRARLERFLAPAPLAGGAVLLVIIVIILRSWFIS